jgi:outer membrane protein
MKILQRVFPLFLSLPLWAADVKIGIVDFQMALQETQAGKKAKTDLEKEFNKRKSEIDKKSAAFQKLQEEFQKSTSILTKEVRAKKEMELQQEGMTLQKMAHDSEVVMRQKEAEMTKPIVEGMRAIIPELSRKHSVDLVLEKNSGILYAVNQTDLTEELIRQYDEKNKAKKK